MAWDAGTITSATPWAALSQKVKDLISGGSGVGNWAFVKNIPAGTSAGQSGSTLYSVDLFRCRGATNLYERIVQKSLGTPTSTTDGTSFVLTVTTPPASRFITVCVYNTKASAADDPTSVALDGSNAPTFTKIKSQASGASGELKMTLWIGKSSASAPTGTQLTVSFGATQTSCTVFIDEWQGVDLTLGADGVDATGATKIGIQVVGNNGTTETAHSATLAAFLDAQKSVAVTWAAQANGSGTYTSGVEANGWVALTTGETTNNTPTTHGRGMWRPDADDVTGVLTLSSNASETAWAAIAFEFQRKLNTGSISNANDAAKDWYFMVEIPVTDGAVQSCFNGMEDYDGFEMFRRCVAAPTTLTPVLSAGWRDNVLNTYANVPGNNRANLVNQALNTSGFNYWIKLTNNSIHIATKVATVEQTMGFGLLDSFVNNGAPDLPLYGYNSSSGGGNSFSRLPGITATVASSAFQMQVLPWTVAAFDTMTSNAANAQEGFAAGGNKIHVGRVFAAHQAGRTTAPAPLNNGYARGLWKQDFLIFNTGGTVLLGDTMTVMGNTWTVIGKGFSIQSGVFLWYIITRAN